MSIPDGVPIGMRPEITKVVGTAERGCNQIVHFISARRGLRSIAAKTARATLEVTKRTVSTAPAVHNVVARDGKRAPGVSRGSGSAIDSICAPIECERSGAAVSIERSRHQSAATAYASICAGRGLNSKRRRSRPLTARVRSTAVHVSLEPCPSAVRRRHASGATLVCVSNEIGYGCARASSRRTRQLQQATRCALDSRPNAAPAVRHRVHKAVPLSERCNVCLAHAHQTPPARISLASARVSEIETAPREMPRISAISR